MAQATHIALYVASVVGAIALLLMMPRRGYNPRRIGALLGAATLGGLWLVLARRPEWPGLADPRAVYYYLFSAIAIAAAARVVTHTRPVFSALWFIMVVLASAGLFLLLSAEFIAFAMLIIYGGAILVTYVFVIMLASQSEAEGAGEAGVEYDRVAREPVAAVAAGFLLLALLLSLMATPVPPNPTAWTVREPTAAGWAASEAAIVERRLAARGPKSAAMVAEVEGQAAPPRLENTERIGLDLFEGHPLGLELAGVVLLVALVGAVVIARKRVEEPPLGPPGGGAGPAAGPTEAAGREPGPHAPEVTESIQGGAAPASGGAS